MSASTQRPVNALDRVSDVLARDERLVEVFVRQSPHFAKLRNPMMRRVMARLVTVEQAARICGAPTESLVHELNRALGIDAGNGASDTRDASGAGDAPDARDTPDASQAQRTPSAPFTLPPDARVVELDVREDLRLGREPFSRIMGAVGALDEDDVLHLRATFEPVPLFAVLAKRGFDHHAQQEGDDDWSVWFYRRDAGVISPTVATSNPALADVAPGAVSSNGAPHGAAAPSVAPSAGEVVLDVRGLEPPEPMQRTLEAAEQLVEGVTLVHINVRVPHFLLPILRERGFDYDIHQANPERVVVRIWRASPAAPTRHAPGG